MKDINLIFSNIESTEIRRIQQDLNRALKENNKYFTSSQVARLHNNELEKEIAALREENHHLHQKLGAKLKISPETNAILQKDPLIKKLRMEAGEKDKKIASLYRQLSEAAATIARLNSNPQ